MLTPLFELSQTDQDVTIVIKAPYANIADTEVYVEDTEFRFCSTPYYLRLHFPGPIQETEYTTGKYDCDAGQFTFLVNKINKGEHFPDLDLVSKLLIPPAKHRVVKPGIEVLDDGTNDNVSDEEDEDDSMWFMDQEIPTNNIGETDGLCVTYGYGFANKTKGTLTNIQEEFEDVLEIKDPDHVSLQERSKLRWKTEQEDFDEDQYLADLMIPDQQSIIDNVISYQPIWLSSTEERSKFTAAELERMKQLGNREYLLNTTEKCQILLSLIDILYAYCYDVRSTLGESNVVSGWTINKLSSTLSWFESFSNIKEVVVACMRRSLCYPLYREWRLSCTVKDDVKTILSQGKRSVLKCLLSIYETFNTSEPRYLLNQLYIHDYCIWMQHVSDKKIRNLADAINEIMISKSDLGFDLDELETAAQIVEKEELERELCNNISTLVLCSSSEQGSSCGEDSSSDSSCSDSEEDSSDSSSSTSTSTDDDRTKVQSLDSDDDSDSE